MINYFKHLYGIRNLKKCIAHTYTVNELGRIVFSK